MTGKYFVTVEIEMDAKNNTDASYFVARNLEHASLPFNILAVDNKPWWERQKKDDNRWVVDEKLKGKKR